MGTSQTEDERSFVPTNSQLSRRNRKQPSIQNDGAIQLNRNCIALMLNVADIVLTSCELALLSTDPEVIARCIGHSKKSYDSLLRAAGRLSFTVQESNSPRLASGLGNGKAKDSRLVPLGGTVTTISFTFLRSASDMAHNFES